MIKDPPLRLFGTSSFRLAIQSAVLSVFGALLVFGIIYHASESAVRGELDATVTSEVADVMSDAHDSGSLVKSVQEATAESAGTFYALIRPDGTRLAGNLKISAQGLARWQGARTMKPRDGVELPPHITAIRGVANPVAGGDVLYVAENATALLSLNHLIRNAFLTVFGTVFAIGIIGGLLVARTALRQIEVISRTSREIMGGDLSRRISLTGTGDEFDRLAENLNAMLERIQSLMVNIQQVSNDIAHDLRSPLARLREHLELARQQTDDAKIRSAFDEGIIQVDAALGIFAAMLRIAEVEAGARRHEFKQFDISNLLSDLAETFETVADSEAMTMSTLITPGLQITGDRELLTQMFVNIIENAIRHCPPGSHITITVAALAQQRVEVVITDNGPGIPASDHQRVLNRFVKLDASRHSPGTGLGLALVAAVVDLHQAQVTLAENHPGLKVGIIFQR